MGAHPDDRACIFAGFPGQAIADMVVYLVITMPGKWPVYLPPSYESSFSTLCCVKDITRQHFIGDTLMMIAHHHIHDRDLFACNQLRCSHIDDGTAELLSLS